MKQSSAFAHFASRASSLAASSKAFTAACLLIVVWGLTGPLFDYSDTWQLVINTSTTVITFLMVFIIQNTQNRDGRAIQIKLDELIRAIEGAHNALLNLEDLTETELDKIRGHYVTLATEAKRHLKGDSDTGRPDIYLEERD